ncbi:MAG: FAD-dependent oxidoreductase [Aquimarina sp.]|nr:FAD-dependent oxidoreductase [Aquimarina sp.]
MKVDYIIVGFGLSGLSIAEHLDNIGKTFMVYDSPLYSSSRVAGGVFNPVVLKRFTAPWNIEAFVDKAIPFYKNLAIKLGDENLVIDQPVLRRFNSIEEQNKWFEACDKPILKSFLSDVLWNYKENELNVPFKLGEVTNTGRIDLNNLLDSYILSLAQRNTYKKEKFQYDELERDSNSIKYKGVESSHLIFAEGHKVVENPYFNHLPVLGNKGEYIVIKSPKLKMNFIFKSSVFIIPLGNHMYKVGATFDRDDKSLNTTTKAQEEIKEKLSKVLNAEYEIMDQVAGIRPTVGDRKPIIGRHFEFSNLYVFNGMGSRGILTAPLSAQWLIDFIEFEKQINPLVDVARFYKKPV